MRKAQYAFFLHAALLTLVPSCGTPSSSPPPFHLQAITGGTGFSARAHLVRLDSLGNGVSLTIESSATPYARVTDSLSFRVSRNDLARLWSVVTAERFFTFQPKTQHVRGYDYIYVVISVTTPNAHRTVRLDGTSDPHVAAILAALNHSLPQRARLTYHPFA